MNLNYEFGFSRDQKMMDLVVTGRYFHSIGWDQVESKTESIGILDGKIVYIGPEIPMTKTQIVLTESEFLMPGIKSLMQDLLILISMLLNTNSLVLDTIFLY